MHCYISSHMIMFSTKSNEHSYSGISVHVNTYQSIIDFHGGHPSHTYILSNFLHKRFSVFFKRPIKNLTHIICSKLERPVDNFFDKIQKVSISRNKICFAINFDQNTKLFIARYLSCDNTIRSYPTCFFCRLNSARLTQILNSPINISIRIGECFLALQKPQTCSLSELFY